jgi:hypothetical protein
MLPVLCTGMTSEIEQQIFKIFWGASIGECPPVLPFLAFLFTVGFDPTSVA